LEEAQKAIELGADEIDVVMNYHQLKSGEIEKVKNEIKLLSNFIHKNNSILKIIIESGLLTMDEVRRSCELCVEAQVDFVKTSTGMVQPAAEVGKSKIMRKILPKNIKIKASGGIKTFEQVKAFYEAGADRIGTSSINY